MIKQCLRETVCLIISALLFNLCLFEYSYSKEHSFFAEKCFIDNRYVLLYKVINWWNDNAIDDNNFICSRRLRCELVGMSELLYNSTTSSLTIKSNYQIEDLISVFKECKKCKGPSYLICTYLNNKYFGSNPVKSIRPIYPTINFIVIQGITDKNANRLIINQEKIGIELEGTVGGLVLKNGKIAFHQNATFLKSCPESSQNQTDRFQTYLTIKNMETGEILAKFKTVIAE